MAERSASNYTSVLVAREKSGGGFDTAASSDAWELVSATGKSTLRSVNVQSTNETIREQNISAPTGAFNRFARSQDVVTLIVNWEADFIIPMKTTLAADRGHRFQITLVNRLPTVSSSEPQLTEVGTFMVTQFNDEPDGATRDFPVTITFTSTDGSVLSATRATSG